MCPNLIISPLEAEFSVDCKRKHRQSRRIAARSFHMESGQEPNPRTRADPGS